MDALETMPVRLDDGSTTTMGDLRRALWASLSRDLPLEEGQTTPARVAPCSVCPANILSFGEAFIVWPGAYGTGKPTLAHGECLPTHFARKYSKQ